MVTRRRLLASSVLAGLFGALPGKGAAAFPGTTWRNWSGAIRADPAARITPGSEDELVYYLRASAGSIRPVGAGHSFTPLVPTDGDLIVLDRLRGILSHDADTMQATIAAGTRLSDCGPGLDVVGQAMYNLPDIDRQTLAGAISTATHGTGTGLKSLSGYVSGLRLVLPSGEVMDLDSDHESDLFHAARVSLGALGIITRVRFRNRSPFRLKTRTWVEETESVLARFDELSAEYQHFEMMPMVHSDHAFVIAHQETEDDLTERPDDDDGGEFLSLLEATPVSLRRPLIHLLAGSIEPVEFVSRSFHGLTNLRFDRFNEMEYSVPADAGPHCLREILSIIEQESIDVVIPLEYRTIAEDDTWLGMASGGPRVSVSVHRLAGHDYRPYFDRVEPVFWKYEGRPHWGKVHTLGCDRLPGLYPKFDAFRKLQREVDPRGRMLNAYLRTLLGRQDDG